VSRLPGVELSLRTHSAKCRRGEWYCYNRLTVCENRSR
jgi:hypothetical protein